MSTDSKYGDPSTSFTMVRRGILLASALIVGLLIAWAGLPALLLGFAAVLLAVLIRRTAEAITRVTSLPMPLTIGLILVAAGSALTAAVVWGAPRLIDQVDRLVTELPGMIANLRDRIAEHPWGDYLLRGLENSGDVGAARAVIGARYLASTTLGGLSFAFVGIVVAIYLACNPRPYIRGFVALFPDDQHGQVHDVLGAMGRSLFGWLLGTMLNMTIVGVGTTVALSLLGLPYAPVLGLIAGLLAFVPTLGPAVALLPATLVALDQGPTMVAWVVGVYLAIQLVESYFITPLIMREMIELPPALVVINQLVAGLLMGLVGVALATPLTAVAIVLVKQVRLRDQLGRDVPLTPQHGAVS